LLRGYTKLKGGWEIMIRDRVLTATSFNPILQYLSSSSTALASGASGKLGKLTLGTKTRGLSVHFRGFARGQLLVDPGELLADMTDNSA
jgi:hypothetical protein